MNERLNIYEGDLVGLRRRFRLAAMAVFAAIAGLGALAPAPTGALLSVGGCLAAAVLAFGIGRPLSRLAASSILLAREADRRRCAESRHDALTGLPNRAHLLEHLDGLLSRNRRRTERVGLCLVDVKGLRRFNEAHGCGCGDLALRRFAGIIRTETRKGDFVARVSSDEFMIVATSLHEAEDLTAIAGRIAQAIREPFEVGAAAAEFDCTAGVVYADKDEVDAHRLVTDVALALRHARDTKTSCALFTPSLREHFDAGFRLRRELVEGVELGQIKPWFQPQIDIRTQQLVGFEALARWDHPQRGLLAPGAFFAAAEDYGLMGRIDEAILASALDWLRVWRRDGLAPPHVGVNLSARRLRDPFLVERIKWALEERDLEPSDLGIEILESVLIDDDETAFAQNLESLSRIGVSVDLDDFGTGHAAIATLQSIKVDRIKIDRSFVTDVDRDPARARVMGSLLDLARSMDLISLAEGVERAGEIARLHELGCHQAQGYAIARPMAGESVAAWIGEYDAGLAAAAARLDAAT